MKLKKYTIQEATGKPSVFLKPPFHITRYGRVIGTFVRDSRIWQECENCKAPTTNMIKFENEKGKEETLILCNECKKKHI